MFFLKHFKFLIPFFIFTSISVAGGLLEDDFFKGFSGRIELCGVTVITNSNLVPFSDEEYELNNEDNMSGSELKRNSKYIFAAATALPFNVEYTLETGTMFYVGTHFYDNIREGLSIGIEKEFDDLIIDLSLFGTGDDVWENPYLTDSERETTTEFISGINLNLIQIFNSSFNIGLKTKYRHVKDDVSGDNYSDLKRNGFVHTVTIEYDHLFEEKKENQNNIVFKLVYSQADIDGDSNSYKAGAFGVRGTYWYKEISFGFTTCYEGRFYEKEHPIFNKKRKDDLLTNGITITFHNLGDSENWYIRGGFSVSNVFSNADFYSSDTFMFLSSLGYNF